MAQPTDVSIKGEEHKLFLLASNDVSVSGFQMKTNWSEEDENQGLVG